MTFLQPFILWGLPLILLPVLIHLFNRLRHRSVPWAAMMFLRSATRKSTRYARLRQFLILLFRVLAILVLVLALSRPLSGGWMGWMISSAPDVIVVLLDRSASMEARDQAGGQDSKRAEAIRILERASAPSRKPAGLFSLRMSHVSRRKYQERASLTCLTHWARTRRPTYPPWFKRLWTGLPRVNLVPRNYGSPPIFSAAIGTRKANAGRAWRAGWLPFPKVFACDC